MLYETRYGLMRTSFVVGVITRTGFFTHTHTIADDGGGGRRGWFLGSAPLVAVESLVSLEIVQGAVLDSTFLA